MERIKVALRMRPFTKEETKHKEELGWKLKDEQNIIEASHAHLYNQPFVFDYIFNQQTLNENLYNKAAKDLVKKSLDGIDTTIFVYGQTGAGKTHTMLGPTSSDFNFNGIIFNSLTDIFEAVKSREADEQYAVTASYLEIYNELVFDLLNKPEQLKHNLTVFEDITKNKFKVKNQTKVKVDSLEEVYKILKYGETNRRYAETYFNHRSSRSHTIFTIHIQYMKYSGEEASYIKESTLNFVDLAGNERLLYEYKAKGANNRSSSQNVNPRSGRSTSRRKSIKGDNFYEKNQQNNRMTESKHINKSLFFLTQVIFMCSKGKNTKHIPFRNSALTKILRSSFGGNSRTLLILCISPSISDFDISLSTLRFGRCAKKIKNEIKSNVITAYNKEALAEVVKSYERKLKACYQRLDGMDEKHDHMIQLFGELAHFKGKFIKSILKFKQKAKMKVESNKSSLWAEKMEDKYDDLINKKAGIVLMLKGKDENGLMYNRKEQDQILTEKADQFKISTIPNVLHLFTEKLKSEEKLEEFINTVLNDLIEQYNIRDDFVRKFIASMSDNLASLQQFANKLYTRIGNLKNELSFFTRPAQIKTLTDDQVDENFNRIKELMAIYQEEKIRRKVLREVNIDPMSLIKEEIKKLNKELKAEQQAETEEYNEFKQLFEREFEDKIIEFDELSEQFDFSKKVEEAQNELSQMIDKIYDDSYNIQRSFFADYKYMKKRYFYFKAKYDWLESDLKTIMKYKGIKKVSNLPESDFNSLREIKIPKENEEEEDFIDSDLQMLYDKFSSKIDKAVSYVHDFKRVKDLRAEDYKEIINKNVRKGLEPVHNIKPPSVIDDDEDNNEEIDLNDDEDDLADFGINKEDYEKETDNKSETQIKKIDNDLEESEKIIQKSILNDKEDSYDKRQERVNKSNNSNIQQFSDKNKREDSPDFIKNEESLNSGSKETPDKKDSEIAFDPDISKVNHLEQKSFGSDAKETFDMLRMESNENAIDSGILGTKDIINNFKKVIDQKNRVSMDLNLSDNTGTDIMNNKNSLKTKEKDSIQSKKIVSKKKISTTNGRVRVKKSMKRSLLEPILKQDDDKSVIKRQGTLNSRVGKSKTPTKKVTKKK